MYNKADTPFLLAAFASFLASVGVWFLVDHRYGAFIGLWVPSILALWAGTKASLVMARLSAEEGGRP